MLEPQPMYLLEELAANAWPAAVVQHVDGWRLRYTWGITRRANSVWPNGPGASVGLADRLRLVEEFYARRDMTARYQVCPAAIPAHLDQQLAMRGYTLDAATDVQVASLATVLARGGSPLVAPAGVSSICTDAWFAAYRAAEACNEAEAAGRQDILRRIGPRTGYATLELEGTIAGIGLGVVERGWLGVFSMATAAAYRRRGVGLAILRALAVWGQSHQATRVYLQVMQQNTAARALYARLGFATLYAYHYREASAAVL